MNTCRREGRHADGTAASGIVAKGLLLMAALLSFAAAAADPDKVDHAFGFDMRRDKQHDVEVLDYRYGESAAALRASPADAVAGKTFVFEGVRGPMPRGESLYVKWRIKSTGQVFEDTVDLRRRLPADLAGSRIHFLIRGPQLLVYLITPLRRPADEPPNGPHTYRSRKTVTLYPDPPNP